MMDIGYAEIIGLLAALIGCIADSIYIISILKGNTKPHLYTWILFSTLSVTAFAAQITEGAGAGSWALGVISTFNILSMLLALKYGTKDIHKSDKWALLASITVIIPWIITKDPMISVILASAINLMAMYPTVRKSWNSPYQEVLSSYVLNSSGILLSITAIANYSITTTLFPLAIITSNTALITICLYRRKTIAAPSTI